MELDSFVKKNDVAEVSKIYAQKPELFDELFIKSIGRYDSDKVFLWAVNNAMDVKPAIRTAILNGGYEVLAVAHDHNIGLDENPCLMAAKAGEYVMMQWLHENCQVRLVPELIACATTDGKQDITRWLYKNGASC